MKKFRILRFSNLVVLSFFCMTFSHAQIEKFQPRQKDAQVVEVWRLTNEPGYRDWGSYHSTECFSPNGRYIAYIHFGADANELVLPLKQDMAHEDLYHPYGTPGGRKIVVFDLSLNKPVNIDLGKELNNPRWAFNHNWLFYNKSKTNELMWLDVDNARITKLADGIQPFSTDNEDRWIYGTRNTADKKLEAVRVRIKGSSRVEILQGSWEYGGNLLYLNPTHPVIVSRDNRFKQHYYATDVWQPKGYLGRFNIPFVSRHFFSSDLEGNNRSVPTPEMEGAHFSWAGDGSWFLCGNGPWRGWEWDKPLPSNLHILGGMVRTSDPSPCGKSGRWVHGSSSGPLWLLDMRSGDGFSYLDALSHIHDSDTFSYCYGSGLSDNDAKGSPDGTKVEFVTNYDLKEGSVTKITGNVDGATGTSIPVESTEGFPGSGYLSLSNEIVKYTSKTPTSFNGISRKQFRTHPVILEHLTPEVRARYEARPVDLRPGQTVSSFDSRVIPENEWKKLPVPAKILEKYGNIEITPLLRQRQTDVYIAVVRLPDSPFLRMIDNTVELIPGENHWETRGYNLFRDGVKISKTLLTAGTVLDVEPGEYTATAVEWSGLESKKSQSLKVNGKTKLLLLEYKPSDFSWLSERWLVNDKEVTEVEAQSRETAVKEIVHIYDGVISKEWYTWGVIDKKFDLSVSNREATRRMYYRDGKISQRDYFDRNGWHATTELFNSQGQITEAIYYNTGREKREMTHWWYENHIPVKCIKSGELYYRDNEVWKKKE